MLQSSSTLKKHWNFFQKVPLYFFCFCFFFFFCYFFHFFYVMKTAKNVEYINTLIFLLKNAFLFEKDPSSCSLSCLSLILVQVSEIEFLIT